MGINLTLQSHAACFHFLFLGFVKLRHGIFQVIAHQLECLIQFFQFIDGNRIGSDFFLAESVQFHTLDNVLQVFHRFYNRTGKPVGNDHCCGKKSSNNSQKDLQHFVCRGKDHRFRLDSQISVACICGIQSGDVFFLICDGTLYGKGILVRISKFVIF